MNKSKIAIISTVINFELYSKSSLTFPDSVQKYVIDGRSGMHALNSVFYMMKKLKNKGIEWLIITDEDVFFVNSHLVYEIIHKMKTEKYIVSGIRDGGLISHRLYNPYLINTFFSIINFKEIEKLWNKKQVLKNNYLIENEFDDDLTKLSCNYDVYSLYEPYYCLYLWLGRNGLKFLFLEANQPLNNDEISNAVYFNKKLLLYHTWYARSYGINKKHTIRINDVMKLIDFKENLSNNLKPIVFKDKFFFIRNYFNKLTKRILLNLKIILV